MTTFSFRSLLIALSLTPQCFLGARDLPTLPEGITSFGAVVVDGKLYSYGGNKGGMHSWSKANTSGSLQSLDLSKPEQWVKLAGHAPVQSPGVAAAGGKIYLVGGMQPQNEKDQDPILKSLDQVSVYDPKTNAWTELPKLPEIRSSHDIVIVDEKLYVIGGWPLDTSSDKPGDEPDDRHKTRPFHKNALVLDLAKPDAGWKTIEQPFERRAVALVASKGKIYVLGGMKQDNSLSAEVDAFDIASGKWEKVVELPVDSKMKAFATAACELNGEVIASPLGGKVFALRSDKWVEVGALKQKRFFHQLEPLGESEVIALGGTDKGDPLNNVEVVTITAP